MTLEDIAHGLVTYSVSQVGQSANDPVVASGAMLPRHAHHQGLDLLVDRGAARCLALLGAVTFLGHQRAVPAEDRVRFDDLGHFRQRVLAQLLAHLSQGAALAITQADAAFDLVTQDAIFGHDVRIASQEHLVDGPRDIRQQCLPIHTLFTLRLCHPQLALSMCDGWASCNPKRE
jgi:hypothetical protein